jgi:uncharacterized membrane protein YfcA
MSQERFEDGRQPARPRRKLNREGIKTAIVFYVAVLTALGSALTGLGAQVAFAPSLTWMLGFAPEKAQATAIRFAMLTASAGVVGFLVSAGLPDAFLLRGLVLVLGATLGALLLAPVSMRPAVVALRPAFQTLGMALALFVIVQTARQSVFETGYYASWNGPGSLFLLAATVGALTQVMGLPGGLLLVPVLRFLAGIPPREAVALSLLVIAIAGLLPAWSYGRRGIVDTMYRLPTTLGAGLGGFIGGWVLGRFVGEQQGWLLYGFALAGMFLCARELAKMRFEKSLER